MPNVSNERSRSALAQSPSAAQGPREVLSLPAAKDLLERLAQLYGVGRARAMQQVDHESGAYKVSGYAALPSVTEASRSRQTLSVNGRWVRAESLTKGIDDAYRATVAVGRYPPVALCVEVDPHQVDVNVHPTKQLVRFSEEKEVRLAISEAVRNAIQGTGDPAPDQDGRTTDFETSDSSLPTASESGLDAPVAAPRRRPAEDHPAGGATSPMSALRRSASDTEGGSGVPDSLFGTSKSSRSDSSKAHELSEQRRRIEEASAPLSRVGSAAGVERGELPRLRSLPTKMHLQTQTVLSLASKGCSGYWRW